MNLLLDMHMAGRGGGVPAARGDAIAAATCAAMPNASED
jgi:hypothetical protein